MNVSAMAFRQRPHLFNRFSVYTWCVFFLVLLVVPTTRSAPAESAESRTIPRAVTPRSDLDAEEKATIALFRQSSPSVVHITTLAVRQDLFTLNLLQIPEGTGSGLIWDDTGNIVTNFHVIQNADGAQVTLADHSTW